MAAARVIAGARSKRQALCVPAHNEPKEPAHNEPAQ